MQYEAVIGLEIHVELNCATKMFCDCPNRPGDEPNRNTCPICLWFPGAIAKFSGEALEKAAMACLALNCRIQERSAFDQKVYYYPDLPKGFQLSQAHRPLARDGWLDITGEDGKPKKIGIHHVHMEEDVAKLVHETEGRTPVSLVDFNRAGVPLVEIVTEPDMRSPHEAMELVRVLRTQIRYVGSSECSMESGTLRVDANISLRPKGTTRMNTKVEVKNMNSIRHLGDAIAYEIQRQTASLESGEPIVLHTRLWDPEKKVTTAMRGKFSGPCVPDPSVPQIVVSDAWLRAMTSKLPEMPARKAERFAGQFGLGREEAVMMSAERDLSEYFEAVVGRGINPKTATHWLATQFLPALRERRQSVAESTVKPDRFAGLLAMLERDEINANAARGILSRLFETDESPSAIVEKSGARQISDTSALEGIVEKVLAANASAVSDFRNGVSKALGFLIGQAMQASGGRANPKLIRDILTKKLGA
ncbi:MAG TPA: Asp-tRNA(Asn)/Glu-tRNA(Gln) amidotransferase subunit GatB [Syntrophales bacterium]|jgi:aspartyl-tRNA(Asn)/glutamyl-tRNA(Gln) amidotransferase subunit B|nr:Asp-tRNA(Asn)/Glu-tRNA(Gln) amidotransferase subunit GatB [Syntrophales bacterium]HRT62136.1 Asp-tRNA(Asn)/Glu-tRNA(Gln) amidotransferase subunit GatB [Syntrophales bacterium]